MHFAGTKNRPVLESHPYISHLSAPDSRVEWQMEQQSLQCCDGMDAAKKSGSSSPPDRPDNGWSLGTTEQVELL